MNVLSSFVINMPKNVSFLQSSDTLPLPRLKGPHLRLQRLHLRIQLCKPLFDVTEAVNFSAKGLVPYTRQRIVDARCVLIVEAEGYEVVDAETGYVHDVEYWCSVNEPLVDLSLTMEHAVGVGVVGHLDLDVFCGHRNPVSVDNVKWDVLRSAVHFESTGNGGLGSWL